MTAAVDPDVKAAALAMLEEGHSVPDVARAVNVDRRTVGRWQRDRDRPAQEAGVHGRRPPADRKPKDRAKARAVYAATSVPIGVGNLAAHMFMPERWTAADVLSDAEVQLAARAAGDLVLTSDRVTRWVLAMAEGGPLGQAALCCAVIAAPRMVAHGRMSAEVAAGMMLGAGRILDAAQVEGAGEALAEAMQRLQLHVARQNPEAATAEGTAHDAPSPNGTGTHGDYDAAGARHDYNAADYAAALS